MSFASMSVYNLNPKIDTEELSGEQYIRVKDRQLTIILDPHAARALMRGIAEALCKIEPQPPVEAVPAMVRA